MIRNKTNPVKFVRAFLDRPEFFLMAIGVYGIMLYSLARFRKKARSKKHPLKNHIFPDDMEEYFQYRKQDADIEKHLRKKHHTSNEDAPPNKAATNDTM